MSKSSRSVVDFILLGPTGDRRQLQDSPILGDVWIKFAARPAEPLDLLINPEKQFAAGPVAKEIAAQVRSSRVKKSSWGATNESQVAYLQGLVVARLSFWELMLFIAPMTFWWKDRKVKQFLKGDERLFANVQQIVFFSKKHGDTDDYSDVAKAFIQFTALDRFFALAAIILASARRETKDGVCEVLSRESAEGSILEELHLLVGELADSAPPVEPKVWQISLNRRAQLALARSVQAVKADAARTVFKVKCDQIAWAVLDSGIDSTHQAFRSLKTSNGDPVGRIVKAFDFSRIREIVSLDNFEASDDELDRKIERLLAKNGEELTAKAKKIARTALRDLARDADNDRPIHWERVEQFIDISKTATQPRGGHGTHVAGIIGACQTDEDATLVDGMCPDIMLYDFRVISESLEATEFAIIAALQYIRYLNERNGFITIHGANLSLSIPHDVRNFACGRTPICVECERLVDNGVVVVAAAGNLGYQSFETKDGAYEGYAAFSITDPGNADGVITVGATHRFWPHTYGVSFFSSRGPTGDGRLKPDIVAPGERISSCLPNDGWGELDGTSMAAPHVSGAAAMLMARYSELIGRPRRIKELLCQSATDLGRERTFQGHGMLDVLRAFQAI